MHDLNHVKANSKIQIQNIHLSVASDIFVNDNMWFFRKFLSNVEIEIS